MLNPSNTAEDKMTRKHGRSGSSKKVLEWNKKPIKTNVKYVEAKIRIKKVKLSTNSCGHQNKTIKWTKTE